MIRISKPDAELLQALTTAGVLDAQSAEELKPAQKSAPKPVAPKPVAPKAVAPKPVAPKAVAPKPVAPKAVAPKRPRSKTPQPRQQNHPRTCNVPYDLVSILATPLILLYIVTMVGLLLK